MSPADDALKLGHLSIDREYLFQQSRCRDYKRANVMTGICEALEKGATFPFPRLWEERDELAEFWNRWWARNGFAQIARPYTVGEDDKHLKRTAGKGSIDLRSYDEAFDPHLLRALQRGNFPIGRWANRFEFRNVLAQYVAGIVPPSENRDLVLLGGGHGAGKSDTVLQLSERDAIPIVPAGLVGVDACKLYLPEMARLKAVYDGRASEIVQDEAQAVSEILLNDLFMAGKSFAWDSCLSERETAFSIVQRARAAYYRIWLVGVFVPPPVAIHRAMKRAYESRQFPNPAHFFRSHQGYSAAFLHYVDQVDRALLIDNRREQEDGFIVAEKLDTEEPLLIHDDERFEEFSALGHAETD